MEREALTNPITEIREVRKLSRKRFALALGVGYATSSAHECGYPAHLQPAMRRGLARLGVDVDQVAREYEAWREQQQDAILPGTRR